MNRSTSGTLVIIVGIVSTIFFAQCSSTIPQTTEHVYQTQSFFSGVDTRELAIQTADEQLISTLEIPRGIALSIYADKSTLRGSSLGNSLPTGEVSRYYGKVSIRTQFQNSMLNGRPASESFAQVPMRIDLDNAVVVLIHK